MPAPSLTRPDRPPSVPLAPGALPLLGHVPAFLRDPVGFLAGLRAYGTLVQVRLGPLAPWVATTAQVAQDILCRQAECFDKGRTYEAARPFLGDSLLTLKPEPHRQHRRIIQPLFNRSRMARYVATMRDLVQATADSWHPGIPLRIDYLATELSTSVVLRSFFSATLPPAEVRQIEHAMYAVEVGVILRTVLPRTLFTILGQQRRFTTVVARFHSIVQDLVERHDSHDASHTDDLVSLLRDARGPDQQPVLDASMILDELTTMLYTGIDTPSTITAWTLLEIGRHPQVERQVHAEIDAVLGQRPVTLDDLSRLRYTQAVVDEAQRLYAVPIVTRRAITTTEVSGLPIPAGTDLVVSPGALHRDPTVFPDPDRFVPSRWLGDGTDAARAGFLPFGAGPRRCIGANYAQTMILTAVGTIAQHWRLRHVPGTPIRRRSKGTICPAGLTMAAHPRHP